MMTMKHPLWLGVGLVLLVWLIHSLAPVLAPFLVALVLAYLMDPVVEFLSVKPWKIPRTLVVTGVFIMVIILSLMVFLFLIPALHNQLMHLVEKLPILVDWIQQKLLPTLSSMGISSEAMDINVLRTSLSKHLSEASQIAKWLWQTIFASGMAFITAIANLFIVFIVTFYLLRDWPVLRKKAKALIPKKNAPFIVHLFSQCNAILSTFVRGQLCVMLAQGIYYSVALTLMGVNFSLLLGILAGLFSIVPYLGSFIGLAAALTVTYLQFHTWFSVLGVVGIFLIGHILEGFVLTPWLIGNKLGLHPVVVIFAVLAGGSLLGLVGVILALPLTAMLVVLGRELVPLLLAKEKLS